MVGNAYIPILDRNANTSGYRRSLLPSVATLAPPTPTAVALYLEAQPTIAPYSNNTPRVFYMAQELKAHFLKAPKPTVPRVPLFTAPHAQSGKASDKNAVLYSATGSVSRKASRKHLKSTLETLGSLTSPADP